MTNNTKDTTKRKVGGPLDRTQWAWGQHQEHRYTGSGFMVLFAMVGHANKKTGQCRPSHETLAEETNLSRRQVVRAIQELMDSGAVILKQSGKANHRASVYLLAGHLDGWDVHEFATVPGMTKPEEVDEYEQLTSDMARYKSRNPQVPKMSPQVTKVVNESAGFISSDVTKNLLDPIQSPAPAGIEFMDPSRRNQPTPNGCRRGVGFFGGSKSDGLHGGQAPRGSSSKGSG